MNSRLSDRDADVLLGRPISFTFDGRRYEGLAGDTLASALLANGVRLVGRSFKWHRPRGILTQGLEEPNALLTVGDGPYREVSVRATTLPLYEGLTARSQNCWPTAAVDLGRCTSIFSRLFPAGFYYKTFKWPGWSWYEGLLRNLAGLGRMTGAPDPDHYATRFHHTDVLIVGAGPAGLAAARAAAATNEDVVLLDGGDTLGGSLLSEPGLVEGVPAGRWAAQVRRELAAVPSVLLLPRTTAFGCYEDHLVAAVQRIRDSGRATPANASGPKQRLWKIRADRIVLATGASERPLVFTNNDRPGIMLASAVRAYVCRYAVSPGSRAVVFTNNDSAYETAFILRDCGIQIAAIVDTRERPGREVEERARHAQLPLRLGSAVIDTRGRRALRSVDTARFTAAGTSLVAGARQTIQCDLLCVSGGWDPRVQLYAQAGGKLRYDASVVGFVPTDESLPGIECVGAATGHFDLDSALRPHTSSGGSRSARPTPDDASTQPVWRIPSAGRQDRRHRQWVDLAHDVTVCDIDLAASEGLRSVEHMKRYTTAGMAIDQGKTASVNALALLGAVTGRAPGEVGTTTFRPPYDPVAIGALAGARAGELAQRYRRLPVQWHEDNGGVMEDHGGWLRPACYPRTGESEAQAIEREVRAARSSVALFDSSSLGKFEVCGEDAARFLHRLYVNNVHTLAPGRLRYGLMLNDNGIIIDDGVFGCLSEHRYLVYTSSAGALDIQFWMEEWRQCVWRTLRVWIDRQTAQWATLGIFGPQARTVLARLGLPLDLEADAFPHMHMRDTVLDGVAVRVRRVSFTGELSFELDVPADQGDSLWRRLLDLGAPWAITPIGMEALDVLRVEKGFFEVGTDTDGNTSPVDVGWGAVIEKKPDDFIGRRSLERPAMRLATRLQLVGLAPVDLSLPIPVGTHLIDYNGEVDGHVTSSCISPHLGCSLALAQVRSGRARVGQIVSLDIGGRRHRAAITDTAFYDPRGQRLRG